MGINKEALDIINKRKNMPVTKEEVTKELPDVEGPDRTNCIEVEGKLIEIEPTMLKYFRNNSVSFYHIIDTVPLPTIFQMTEENSGIDGDAMVLTFIAAVLDDKRLAKAIYEKLDAGQLLKLVEIFKRVNGIDTRENNSKNGSATRGKA